MTVDLRSDTVTTPTPEMRRAMADAEVGDDAYGEDPTVNRLQSLAAALLGTDAALFVPSGTMANQIALRLHAAHGHEVLCAARAHVYRYESGGAAANSGIQLRPLPDGDGVLKVAGVSFTPGKRVYVAVYDVMGAKLYDGKWVKTAGLAMHIGQTYSISSANSGGPLVVPVEGGGYIQAGIVSWGLSATTGQGCEETALFSAYTNISKFVPWLNETIEANP